MTVNNHQLYSQMTAKALAEAQKKIKVLYDYEMLSGTGIKFYLNIDSRQMVPIVTGKLITRLTEVADTLGRHIVYSENQKILVPESDLISIGIN